jgi:hypothetical protein
MFNRKVRRAVMLLGSLDSLSLLRSGKATEAWMKRSGIPDTSGFPDFVSLHPGYDDQRIDDD